MKSKTARTKRQPAESKPRCRWMIRRDMEEVFAIEAESFEWPWTEADFIRNLRQRNCIAMVAVDDDERVLGFMVYELHKARLHLMDFAVAKSARREGIGRLMVAKLLGKLSLYRRTRITLETRETNLDAQLFFRSQGFRCTGTMREFYDVTNEDAYVFEYRVREASA